jgi:DNA recombination protein RmuC
MALNLMIAILLAITVGLITHLLRRRQTRIEVDAIGLELAETKSTLATVKADFDARQEELRNSLKEARERENEAKTKATEAEQRHADISAELKVASQEKGQFQNEATRVKETKATLLERDLEIQALNAKVTNLDREKTEALKDAEAANNRATEMVAKEREAQQAIVKAKDEQITKLNEFITQARDVLKTEFKALSADALRDASAQLVKTADGLIEKHGEKTNADVKLHQQHIETMLKPVIRGSWGEMTLENALENAGLEAEIDFILQHSTDAEDGRKRTDALINLPKGRKLIIDSKNLMESYIGLANTEDEAQKAILAETHSRSLRNRYKITFGQGVLAPLRWT